MLFIFLLEFMGRDNTWDFLVLLPYFLFLVILF